MLQAVTEPTKDYEVDGVPEPPRQEQVLVDGRYRLLSQLGAGSMGIVYRADDIFLERVVALKFIDPSMARDENNIHRFFKEARSLAKIRHPNVVQVYAFGEHKGSPFFAMEHVAGRSLESIIDDAAAVNEVVPIDRAMEIAAALASGLDTVHAGKLVHRDVKPGNIVIEGESGRPVLIDFGLARRKSASNPRVSIAAGTPMYMAPEQARDVDGSATTGAADQYALACTIFELLTGQPVFQARDVYELLKSHFNKAPTRVSSIRSELMAFDGPLVKALSKDPKDRYPSCLALMKDLEKSMAAFKLAKADTSTIRAPSMVGPEERVLLLVEDAGLRRRIGKIVGTELESQFRSAWIEEAGSTEDAWESVRKAEPGILVIDEDAINVPMEELVANVQRLAKNTNLLVLSRSWLDLRVTIGGLRCDVLPKPLNVQMLSGAISRIAMRRSAIIPQ